MQHKVGDRWFPSKAAIKQYCRDIIKATELNHLQRGKVDEKHMPFLVGLVERHPNYEEKWGSGISYFVVHGERKGLAFIRTDHSQGIFSFLKAADGREWSPKAYFNSAARWAIRDTIVVFRDKRFGPHDEIPSDLSGDPVTRETCHVDHHEPSFREIINEFCEKHDWKKMELADGFGKVFANAEDMELFRCFHDERAKLRILTAEENLRVK